MDRLEVEKELAYVKRISLEIQRGWLMLLERGEVDTVKRLMAESIKAQLEAMDK